MHRPMALLRAGRRPLLLGVCFVAFSLGLLLWVRGYFAWERVAMTTAHSDSAHQPPWSGFTDYYLTNTRGSIEFGRFRWTGSVSAYAPGVKWNYAREQPRSSGQIRRSGDRVNLMFAGFALLYTASQNSVSYDSVVRVNVPPWAMVVAGSIPPALWLRRRRLDRVGRGFTIEPSPPPLVES